MSITDCLKECAVRIGYMCSAGRPPRMSIPVREDDDDVFITTTCLQAVKEIERLTAERGTLQKTMDAHSDMCVKRVIRLTKERNALNAENERLTVALNRYSADEVRLTKESTIAAQQEQIERLTAKHDALKAKLTALEGQDAIGYARANLGTGGGPYIEWRVQPRIRDKFYLAAGATPESLFNGHDAEHWNKLAIARLQEILELEDERDALKPDAERFVVLAEAMIKDNPNLMESFAEHLKTQPETVAQIRAAIDAAKDSK